jgi:SAM-dependent methyltransferase
MITKTFFIERLIAESAERAPRILELACGTAVHTRDILKAHPEYSYVGLEPYMPSFTKASELLRDLPNVRLVHQLGYDTIPGIEPESFDIVFSLSALEHVKHLDSFIRLSAKYAKKGALVVHLYDLGHALYSRSYKERFQVFLGNRFPNVLSESKFVRYVPKDEVTTCMSENGIRVDKSTYHQMPCGKAFEHIASSGNTQVMAAYKELLEWEYTHATDFDTIPQGKRERMFLSTAVWGRKV